MSPLIFYFDLNTLSLNCSHPWSQSCDVWCQQHLSGQLCAGWMSRRAAQKFSSVNFTRSPPDSESNQTCEYWTEKQGMKAGYAERSLQKDVWNSSSKDNVCVYFVCIVCVYVCLFVLCVFVCVFVCIVCVCFLYCVFVCSVCACLYFFLCVCVCL